MTFASPPSSYTSCSFPQLWPPSVERFSIKSLLPRSCRLVFLPSQNANNAAGISISTLYSGAASIILTISDGPPGQFGYLLVGDGNNTVSQPPGAKGDLCVVGGNCLGRYDKDVGQIDSAGTFSTDIKNAISNACNGGVVIVPGATWYWQYWHRQPMGQPATFSAALATTFY